MSILHEFPPLYGVDKNGKTKIWKTRILNDNGVVAAVIEYGLVDGKQQTTTRTYIEGKNMGKKNETSPLEQCMSETKRKWNDKKEKENYRESIEDLNTAKSETEIDYSPQNKIINSVCGEKKIFPMLAHKYEPNSGKNKRNDIEYPCFVQPKLDGLRCVVFQTASGVVAQSRTGSFFTTLEHITYALSPLFVEHPSLVLDGELYTKEIPFEELAGLIKKKKISEDDKQRLRIVQYHVYDIIDGRKYEARKQFLDSLADVLPQHVVLVNTQCVNNKHEFMGMFSEYVSAGYEGIMLRNRDGIYRENYRSHDLQKYKEFEEREYPIIGYKEAEGRDAGTVIWVCKTDEGREFSVRPRGTLEYRRDLLANAAKYLGKPLTVIYQELSEQKVPRFPVGKAIRVDY